MKTKIIVLIDFSPYTPELLKFAGTWSEKCNSDIVIIHQLYSPGAPVPDEKNHGTSLVMEKNRTLKKIRAMIGDIFKEGTSAKIEVITGDLIEYLMNLPDIDSNDPVLLGMKGDDSGNNPVMGKLTKAIIENLNCPAVIIPVTLKTYAPISLTVGLSCKYPLNKPAFNNFLTRISALITNIRFISVMASAREYKRCREYLLNLSMEYGRSVSAESEVFEGISAFRQIKEYIGQFPDTMFVVQKGAQLFTDKLSHKFLVNDLVYDTSIPLIVIPQ